MYDSREKSQTKSWYRGLWPGYKLTVAQLVIKIYSTAKRVSRMALISVLLKCQADLKFVYLFCQNDNESELLFFSYCRHPLVWPNTSNYMEHKIYHWCVEHRNMLTSTHPEDQWVEHRNMLTSTHPEDQWLHMFNWICFEMHIYWRWQQIHFLNWN